MRLNNRTTKQLRNIIDESSGRAFNEIFSIVSSLNTMTCKTFPVAFGVTITPSIENGRTASTTSITVHICDDMNKLERFLDLGTKKLGTTNSVNINPDMSTTELIDIIERLLE